MTIKEASELVKKSSVRAKGGDLFLLDIGELALIKDLSCKVISLRGLKVKDANNPNIDLEIVKTVSRAG